MAVFAAVPSLHHSSGPLSGSLAWKNARSPAAVKYSRPASPLSLMMVTCWVPKGPPSVTHSCSPAESVAAKSILPARTVSCAG